MRAYLIAACILLVSSYAHAEDLAETEKIQAPYAKLFADGLPKCMEDNGLPKGEVKEMHKKLLELEDKHKVGCVQMCVLEANEVLEDGNVKLDKMNEIIAVVHKDHPDMQKKIQEAAAQCKEEVKDVKETCDRTYKYVSCFTDHHHM